VVAFTVGSTNYRLVSLRVFEISGATYQLSAISYREILTSRDMIDSFTQLTRVLSRFMLLPFQFPSG
jgi:hypothetical protein